MDTHTNELFLAFLGAMGKFRKVTINFFMPAFADGAIWLPWDRSS